jgi:hypothetical protein
MADGSALRTGTDDWRGVAHAIDGELDRFQQAVERSRRRRGDDVLEPELENFLSVLWAGEADARPAREQVAPARHNSWRYVIDQVG